MNISNMGKFMTGSNTPSASNSPRDGMEDSSPVVPASAEPALSREELAAIEVEKTKAKVTEVMSNKDSFEEAFAHQSKYPSHHNNGYPIHWVILPPKSEVELTKK